MFDPLGETLRNDSAVAPVTTEDLVLTSPELMSEGVKGRAASATTSSWSSMKERTCLCPALEDRRHEGFGDRKSSPVQKQTGNRLLSGFISGGKEETSRWSRQAASTQPMERRFWKPTTFPKFGGLAGAVVFILEERGRSD